MKLTRDNATALGILVLLLVVSIAVALREAEPTQIPLLSSSADPNGAKALALWLDDVGFDVSTQKLSSFELDNVDAMLMLAPSTSLTLIEVETIEAWLDDGGQLILAGTSEGATQLAARFGFEVRPRLSQDGVYQRQAPLLTGGMSWDEVSLDVGAVILSDDRTDFVTHLAYDGFPILISFEEGDGRVFLSTFVRPFSNAGLKEEASAALVLDVLRSTDSESVWFNDWHHGVRNIDIDSVLGFNQWMRRTPAGQAFIYAAAVIFVGLLWQGRKFGRNVPLPNATTRRAPIEYITAIANLNRRAGNRQAILADYALRLKRHLGRRYRVDAKLPNAEYVAQLKAAHPNIDVKAVSDLLNRLNQPNVTEDQLVEFAAEISEFVGERVER